MKATIAILSDGRRIVCYFSLGIPDVLDDGQDAPAPPADWKRFER